MMTQAKDQKVDPEQLINETDAANLMCQSVRTIQKWRVTGFGPAFFKIGRSVRYRRSELITWIDGRRMAHTSTT